MNFQITKMKSFEFKFIINFFLFSRQRSEAETSKLIVDLDRHAKRMLETNSKERIEYEKKISYAIS